jgi:hypothetical protein
MVYLDVKAKSNLKKRDKSKTLLEEKKDLCEKALQAVTEVYEILKDEHKYSPVMVLGVKMEPMIINSLVGILLVMCFAVVNSALGFDNPF